MRKYCMQTRNAPVTNAMWLIPMLKESAFR
jgi:hypothetical protein